MPAESWEIVSSEARKEDMKTVPSVPLLPQPWKDRPAEAKAF
jgi:hypothetical protein